MLRALARNVPFDRWRIARHCSQSPLGLSTYVLQAPHTAPQPCRNPIRSLAHIANPRGLHPGPAPRHKPLRQMYSGVHRRPQTPSTASGIMAVHFITNKAAGRRDRQTSVRISRRQSNIRPVPSPCIDDRPRPLGGRRPTGPCCRHLISMPCPQTALRLWSAPRKESSARILLVSWGVAKR